MILLQEYGFLIARPTAKLAKISAGELRKLGEIAQAERISPGVGSVIKRRIEAGEIATDLGRLRISFDQGADVATIHGVNFQIRETIDDVNLANAFRRSMITLSELQDAQEQQSQRIIVSAIVNEVLRRTTFLHAAVREQLHRQRYSV